MRSLKSRKKPPERAPRQPIWIGLAVVALLGFIAVGVVLIGASGNRPMRDPLHIPGPAVPPAALVQYAKSPSCRSCHEEEYALWERSHHALAERDIDPRLDAAAFQFPFKIRHGTQVSWVTNNNGVFQIFTMGKDGKRHPFTPVRVLGVEPLRQFLVPADAGRMQVTELAYDPAQVDWFDVYGEEDRHAGEWGHWTGHGMTWNSMCASCHNTALQKNYEITADAYHTTMVEHGVGCESCHGPMADHNAWQAAHPKQGGDPTIKKPGREELFALCGSCHSRRGDLTGDFRPGQKYADHFSLVIPDETDLFYPDGQVHDEDFEFTAFSGSRMHAAGVRCSDCHEPHSAKVRIPGDNLCMVCHAAPAPPAPKIDPATHSHHKTGERGDHCVDCHMPQTVYMQRHARHDHGFTVPDPLMTRDFGIPNACNRCHTDRSADWSLQSVEEWYGDKMQRPTRARTQVLARARRGDAASVPDLIHLMKQETNGFWRAVSANFVKRWISDPQVVAALSAGLGDSNALARSMSIRALEPLSNEEPIHAGLTNALSDPVREVRLDAAWALRATLDTNSVPGRELLAHLDFNADQPSGALQAGVFHLDRGDVASALTWFKRAVQGDGNSAPLRQALAVALSDAGKSREAVTELETACKLAPQEAEYRYKFGLARNEVGDLEGAKTALAEAVKLDPALAPAWYNLGLAENASGKPEAALEALVRAESLDARSAQIPFARATILARLGRTDEARLAARRALEIQPGYPQAAALLQELGQ
jgi:tetratricopeptide (TPR) repeat protein